MGDLWLTFMVFLWKFSLKTHIKGSGNIFYFTICLKNIVTTAVDVFPLFTIYNFVKSPRRLSLYVRDLSLSHWWRGWDGFISFKIQTNWFPKTVKFLYLNRFDWFVHFLHGIPSYNIQRSYKQHSNSWPHFTSTRL